MSEPFDVYTEAVDEVIEDIYDHYVTGEVAPMTCEVDEAAALISEGFCPRRCPDARLEPVLGRLGCPICRSLWRNVFCADPDCRHLVEVEEGRLTDAGQEGAFEELTGIIRDLLAGGR